MEQSSQMTQALEGMSTSRPPFFNGTDYPYLKKRMDIYLNTLEKEVIMAIEDGYTDPIKEDPQTKSKIPKPRRE